MLGVKGLKDANTCSSLLAYVGCVFCVVHIGSATALCIGWCSLITRVTFMFIMNIKKSSYHFPGINGVLALKDEAYKRRWIVLAHEHFEPVSDPNSLDVIKQLKWIRQTGTRIVVLNCYLRYSRQVSKSVQTTY